MKPPLSRLTGRAADLRTLDRALADARAGRGRALFITGEEGIGRSRLAAEAEHRAAAAGFRVLHGRGSAIGPAVSLRPWQEALLSLGRGAELPEAAELGPYLPVLGRLVPDWEAAGGGRGDESLITLAEAVLRLTAMVGRHSGCLVVLDDLQDADPATFAVLEYFIDNLDGQATLLLGTVRDEPGVALDLVQAASRRRGCALVRLDRLSREDVRRVASAWLGADGRPETLPEPVVDRLWTQSAGNPLAVEELLRSMVDGGQLTGAAGTWMFTDDGPGAVPASLIRAVVRRSDRLGPQVRRLLVAAAVLGRRFPLAVACALTGIDEGPAQVHLQAALDQRLWMADRSEPGWYAFVQPFAADALLAQVPPVERAELARRAADQIESRHSVLPGGWCELVARLRLDAGDPGAAGRRYADAGRQAMRRGAFNDAAAHLECAWRLLSNDPEPAARADALESLLRMLIGIGRPDRALVLADVATELTELIELAEPADHGGNVPARLSPAVRASLHTRLAWAAMAAGRPADGMAHADTARAHLGPSASGMESAAVDAVVAHLTMEVPGPDPFAAAEVLAWRVAQTIRAEAPASATAEAACEVWHVLGVAARRRDLDEATAYFTRLGRLANEHRLPHLGLVAQTQIAIDSLLRDGDTGPLGTARANAEVAGAPATQHFGDTMLAFHGVLAGHYPAVDADLDRHLTSAVQRGLGRTVEDLSLVRVVLAAHRGHRREMEAALCELRHDADEPRHRSLVYGLARAFCALLEEDRPRARAELELARIAADGDALGAWQAVGLLLDALAGKVDEDGCRAAAASPAGQLRWDRHFILLAQAVLAGQNCRVAEANALVEAACQTSAPYPMAHHLGLRLVAEAAQADRWGEPMAWLREAEEFFHSVDARVVAAACRNLLREAGMPIRQRRTGSARVPPPLRTKGVTVREFEVLALLRERPTNQLIAERLYISPRTAEKHVANLIRKTGVPGRSALCDAAGSMIVDGGTANNSTR